MKVHFSSATPEWGTPMDFFDELDKEFKFHLDVCATLKNAKCKKFFSIKEDGLKQKWNKKGRWAWMNPPYGRAISDWIKKASEERNVVALLPARTDTKWFHDYIYKKKNVEIRFIKGRLKFEGGASSAPFPSMVVIFK